MPKRILVVDDEPDMQHLIQQKFRKKIRNNEYNFAFANNGAEALEKVKNDPDLDIVLSDINMPVMDGLTFLSEVNDINAALKTVIVSAYGDMNNIRTAMNRGAFDFLLKPIDFNDLEITIEKTLKNAQESKSIKEQRADLNAASKIQRSILPKKLPDMPGILLATGYQPMSVVGGDIYDFHIIDEKRIGILVADVSGHGVQAALVASMVKIAFMLQKDHAHEPNVVLENMNLTLFNLLEETFLTAVYAYIDLEAMKIKISSGAHPPLFIWKKSRGELVSIKSSGRLLGWFPEVDCEVREMDIEPGDRIILYTDGITEAINPTEEEFGNLKFQELIENMQDFSASYFVANVFNELASWTGWNEPNFDDLTMVVADIL